MDSGETTGTMNMTNVYCTECGTGKNLYPNKEGAGLNSNQQLPIKITTNEGPLPT